MMKRFLFLFMILFCGPVWAQDVPIDLTYFAKTPIMNEGRVKPMDSFARAQLRSLSGAEDIASVDAVTWLVEVLFDPVRAAGRPVIKVRNPDVRSLLSLSGQRDHLYSYTAIVDALNKKRDVLISAIKAQKDSWTPAQKDLVLLHDKVLAFDELMSSLTLFLPLSITVMDDAPDYLQDYKGQTLTYLKALSFFEGRKAHLDRILKEKGNNLSVYTLAEQLTAYLSFTLENLRQKGVQSQIFRIIPAADVWQAPWQIVGAAGGPAQQGVFNEWQKLVAAFHSRDGATWQAASRSIYDMSVQSVARPQALGVEYWYNQITPFRISFIFALITLALLGARHFTGREDLSFLAASAFLTGGLVHFCGIAARIYILQRPPVSTLYESVLFVGLIIVAYGVVSWFRTRQDTPLIMTALGAVIVHLLGFSHAGDGDNMMMLTAVLNTNFWLATHVLCISTGYAFCLVTSLMAHYALVSKVWCPDLAFDNQDGLKRAALLALLFSAVGTVLGGIWADQSWGRFWGWDPKENGALLIVLWLIWVLHGRIAGRMSATAMNAGLAFLSVIVALSWFGVNLLSVGLHSYGFTDSAAWALGLFGAAELAFVALTLWRDKQKLPRVSA